jgi:hypothetical protein
VERSEAPGIGRTMRPSSEGAPESTLARNPGSTHLPLLQSLLDFYTISLGFRFASPRAAPSALNKSRCFRPRLILNRGEMAARQGGVMDHFRDPLTPLLMTA